MTMTLSKYVITDINTLNWEKCHPGTAYAVSSQAKTIGEVMHKLHYPTNSNLFFTGSIRTNRFTKCLYKDNGQKCVKVQKRNLWTHCLIEKVTTITRQNK